MAALGPRTPSFPAVSSIERLRKSEEQIVAEIGAFLLDPVACILDEVQSAQIRKSGTHPLDGL